MNTIKKTIPIGCDIKMLYDVLGIHTKEEYVGWIRELMDCGFSNFNFDFGYHTDNAPVKTGEHVRWANIVREAFDETGAKSVIVHEPQNNFFEMDDDLRKIRKNCYEAYSIIDMGWMIAHPKSIAGNFNREEYKKCLEENYEYFARAAEELEKYNVRVAIETLASVFAVKWNGSKRMFGDNPYDLIEIVDRVGSDKLQLCIDTGHLHLNHQFDMGDVVRDMGSRLKALHVHDNDGIDDLHTLPYMGHIDWKNFVDALYDIGYDGVFTYEASKIPMKYPRELRPSCIKFMHDIAEYIVNL